MKRTQTILALLLWSVFVSAQEIKEFPDTSGNAFVRLCSAIDKDGRTDREAKLNMACIGYVSGVVDGVFWEVAFVGAKGSKEPPKPYCLPENTENGQLIRIVMKYIRNHPEEAHQKTAFLIFNALGEAFPCKSKPCTKGTIRISGRIVPTPFVELESHQPYSTTSRRIVGTGEQSEEHV